MFYSRKYKIEMTNPCSEDWNKMASSGKGRHCDTCSKLVVDFVGMSEKEILLYIKKNKTGGCGRFTQNQIDKIYVAQAAIPLSTQKRLLRFLLSLFVTTKIIPEQANAQTDTIQSAQIGSTKAIVENDTVCADTTAYVGNDSINCAEDSIDPRLVVIVEDPQAISFPVTIVYGTYIPYNPFGPDPSFDPFKKEKKAPERGVEYTQAHLPMQPKQPSKKEESISPAIMPEELRRRSEKRS